MRWRMARRRVAWAEYASESEVVRDGLRARQARDRAVEYWLREEAVPAYDAMKADAFYVDCRPLRDLHHVPAARRRPRRPPGRPCARSGFADAQPSLSMSRGTPL